jgi:hypothetical protein
MGALGAYILRVRKLLFALLAALPSALALAPGCGGSSSHAGSDASVSFDVVGDRSRLDAPIHPDAPCLVTIDAPAFLPALHVPVGTHVDYDSNPPSSGPHYPIWAAFQAFSTPVQREYYVHDLEHGAVVLLYKCATPDGCPSVVAGLKSAADAIPTDPLCDPSIRVRTVITPDPLLDVPIAAAAWGWTYKADCLDVPTLTQFAKDHYAQGPESICANGVTTF